MRHLRFIEATLLTTFVINLLYSTTLDQVQREVIVKVNKNVIVMPAFKNEATLSEITVNSHRLFLLLKDYQVELIIKAFPDFNPSDTFKIARTGEIVKLPDLSDIYKFRFPKGTNIKAVLQDLRKIKDVVFADPNLLPEPEEIYPNDPYFTLQWNLEQYTDWDIDAPEAWEITKGSSSVKIGIIDGGVDNYHLDLNGKVIEDDNNPGWGWNGHGFHVAGIAAALTNNNTGIAGINWYAQIISQRIDNLDVPGVYQAIMDAVNNGAHIINNSWSYSDYITLIRIAFANAYKLNVVSVAAMGNDGDEVIVYPAGFGQGIIAVGASTQDSTRAYFSNWGSHIDICAPGEYIWSTVPNSGYSSWSGTSMATPHVSGVASLLLSYNPGLYNDDIEQILKISADDIVKDDDPQNPPNIVPGWDEGTGAGQVNAYKALNLLRSPWEIKHLTATGDEVHSSTDWYQMIFYSTSGLDDGLYIVKRYDVRKTITVNETYEEMYIWRRGVATKGFSAENPNFGMGWCQVYSINGNNVTFRTFVYDVYTVSGEHVGWIPASPQNVIFAYTILGRRPLYAPSNLYVISVTESSVKLGWTDNSDNEMGFKIEIKGGQYTDWTEIKTVNQNTTSTTIQNLEFNTTYQFRVRAYAQEFYSDYSNVVSATTDILNPPSDLHATVNSDYTVTLSWSDNSWFNDGYEVWRESEVEGKRLVASIGDVTSYTDNTAKFGHEYRYFVYAVKGGYKVSG
jgi:subtilisin family serine protease